MGRGKKSVAQGWNAINKKRDKEAKTAAEEFEKKHKKKISSEEHEKKVAFLKKIGVLKE